LRLWSLHPKYLDAKGLVALWRESLLAQKVLQGLTVGYRNHPQLNRFKNREKPVEAIATYLAHIHTEAVRRGYCFDATRIAAGRIQDKIAVTDGQLEYELVHLRKKLRSRDRSMHSQLKNILNPEAHPLFRIIPGPVEDWEVKY